MRTIFVLFDSLNRHFLHAYGDDLMETPNFKRLASRSVTFQKHNVGSLPCMPARRDLLTGRLNFMHRSWGPIEPFDQCFTDELRRHNVYSHLITDHYHYWEDGGNGYYNRFNSYEFVRGQEGDAWKANVKGSVEKWEKTYHKDQHSSVAWDQKYHDMVNREYIKQEEDFPSAKSFNLACEFLDANHDADNWFLQMETFDPHEPFFAPERLRERFPTDYEGPVRDWPPYGRVNDDQLATEEIRANYKALLALCDEHLGLLLDKMDEHNMWNDTMLVVSTDHGYLLGEHDWWAKNKMPAYSEISQIPLFMHHPDHASLAGQQRTSLTQTPDLMPTFLEAHGVPVPKKVRGHSLLRILEDDNAKIHDAVIFGYYGGALNLTDGRYSYFRYPPDMESQTLYQYTLMPCHMKGHFTEAELMKAELVTDCEYTEGVPVLKIPVIPESPWYKSHGPASMCGSPSLLFDNETDPGQNTPIDDQKLHDKFAAELVRLMKYHNAPPEAYERLELSV